MKEGSYVLDVTYGNLDGIFLSGRGLRQKVLETDRSDMCVLAHARHGWTM